MSDDRNANFRTELEHLINRHSQECNSDTPDFVLAEYLCNALRAFDDAVNAREKWFGRSLAHKAMETICRHGHVWPACPICHSAPCDNVPRQVQRDIRDPAAPIGA